MMSNTPLPTWLNVEADGSAATVTLRKPATIDGVERKRLTLRAPCVRDVRIAQKTGQDEAEREQHLFARLADVAPDDIDALRLTDYQRVQQGYFRLASDDDDVVPNPSSADATPGA